MSSQATMVWMVDVWAQAEAGVDFTSRYGALCPACGKRTRVITTRPWDGPVRIRYHQCATRGCVIAGQGKMIKSVEEE